MNQQYVITDEYGHVIPRPDNQPCVYASIDTAMNTACQLYHVENWADCDRLGICIAKIELTYVMGYRAIVKVEGK